MNCFKLFRHEIAWALRLALARAGKSMPARIAIMAMTTRSSMSVKPFRSVAVFAKCIIRLASYRAPFTKRRAKGSFSVLDPRVLSHSIPKVTGHINMHLLRTYLAAGALMAALLSFTPQAHELKL